ncbi:MULTISPECIES: hypothetical protein [Stenotrophomonas]|uniref:hypothetical protein n=1 Tax=Stenotrophomonas TaxID=40323 RepID=UPI000871C30F|nr:MULTISPECIES: hypothetical protein [Stenotrophomonas]OEZ02281.1 hypothetical protein BIY45_01770 [Stenotrophomonas sp. BIIR7]
MTSIHVRPLFGSASDREKDEQRQRLAADVAEFRRKGGRVQILGNDPISKAGITRRQVVEGGLSRRRKAKKGAAA